MNPFTMEQLGAQHSRDLRAQATEKALVASYKGASGVRPPCFRARRPFACAAPAGAGPCPRPAPQCSHAGANRSEGTEVARSLSERSLRCGAGRVNRRWTEMASTSRRARLLSARPQEARHRACSDVAGVSAALVMLVVGVGCFVLGAAAWRSYVHTQGQDLHLDGDAATRHDVSSPCREG